jgi:hypothetical protein
MGRRDAQVGILYGEGQVQDCAGAGAGLWWWNLRVMMQPHRGRSSLANGGEGMRSVKGHRRARSERKSCNHGCCERYREEGIPERNGGWMRVQGGDVAGQGQRLMAEGTGGCQSSSPLLVREAGARAGAGAGAGRLPWLPWIDVARSRQPILGPLHHPTCTTPLTPPYFHHTTVWW